MIFEFKGETYEVSDEYKWVGIDDNGEVWVFTSEPWLAEDPIDGDFWDNDKGQKKVGQRVFLGHATAQPIVPIESEVLTIQMPVGMKDWFLGFMSACAEQSFMEAYHDYDGRKPGHYFDIRYPYFGRRRGEEVDSKYDVVIQEKLG